MNPDAKKRGRTSYGGTTSDNDSLRSRSPSTHGSDDEMAFSSNHIDAERAYNRLMKSNCSDAQFVRKIFDRLDPIPRGILHQMVLDNDEEYNHKCEVFAEATRINGKTKSILLAVEPVVVPEPGPVVSSSTSSGILGGMFGSRA